jgi:CBS domain-containing protein
MPTRVQEVMTIEVVVANPTTPVKEVADLLAGHGLSALPVTDGRGRVLGVVSDTDLLGDSQRPAGGPAAATAGEVMTSPAVTVTPHATLTEAARRMQAGGVKRLPVVARSGRLVGIVSRADLLRALVAAPPPAGQAAAPDDRTLHDAILTKIRAEPWSNAVMLNVVASGGEVELWGFVSSEEQRAALRVLAETVPGVRTVHDKLTIMPRWAHAY